MGISGMMLITIGFVLIFRVLIEKFFYHAEYQKRLGYAVGMMLCYTMILMSVIYLSGEYMVNQMSVKDFRVLLCAVVFAMNLVIIFAIALICSVAKKRSLSSREKIKLKDL